MEKLTLNDFDGDVEQYNGYLEIYRIMEEMESQRPRTKLHTNQYGLTIAEEQQDDTNTTK